MKVAAAMQNHYLKNYNTRFCDSAGAGTSASTATGKVYFGKIKS